MHLVAPLDRIIVDEEIAYLDIKGICQDNVDGLWQQTIHGETYHYVSVNFFLTKLFQVINYYDRTKLAWAYKACQESQDIQQRNVIAFIRTMEQIHQIAG